MSASHPSTPLQIPLCKEEADTCSVYTRIFVASQYDKWNVLLIRYMVVMATGLRAVTKGYSRYLLQAACRESSASNMYM